MSLETQMFFLGPRDTIPVVHLYDEILKQMLHEAYSNHTRYIARIIDDKILAFKYN